jgi:hypothetical protein
VAHLLWPRHQGKYRLENSLGAEWRQYETIFPALATSRIDQVSVECPLAVTESPLCREPPATVNEGEIVVASKEELHAARITGKRLLALWNALPDIEKRRKVGDRGALIDQLWLAIEALPDPHPT